MAQSVWTGGSHHTGLAALPHENIQKEQTQVYHYMNPSKNIPHFKPLLDGKHLCVVQFRVLKIKTAPNTFEYI